MAKIFAWLIITTLFLVGSAYAEVMDKEPSLEIIYLMGIAGAGLCFLIGRFIPWLLVLAPYLPYALLSEIRDPYVGPAILKEAGYFYVGSSYGLALIMILMAFAGLLFRRRSKQHTKLFPTD